MKTNQGKRKRQRKLVPPPTAGKEKLGPRFTIRVTNGFKEAVDAMPHFEKRRFPRVCRLWLQDALKHWNETHPRTDGRQLRIKL